MLALLLNIEQSSGMPFERLNKAAFCSGLSIADLCQTWYSSGRKHLLRSMRPDLAGSQTGLPSRAMDLFWEKCLKCNDWDPFYSICRVSSAKLKDHNSFWVSCDLFVFFKIESYFGKGKGKCIVEYCAVGQQWYLTLSWPTISVFQIMPQCFSPMGF